MTALGVDYAWQHPDPAASARAGYTYVIRYLSTDPSKNLTPAERDALHSQGLAIVLVWETSAERALDGTAAGIADARQAVAQATALGYPPDVPLFAACDCDTTANQVRPYFQGFATVRPCCGAYGGIRVVDPLLDDRTVRYTWQSCAWSVDPITGRPEISTTAHMYQRLSPTLRLPGKGFDEDVILRPLPAWTPAQPSAPLPVPPKPLLAQETDMRVIRNTDNGRCYLAGPGTLFWLETEPQLTGWLNVCGQVDALPATTVVLADMTHTNPKEPA